MGIEDLRRWHWVIIGLMLGAALGSTRVFFGPDLDSPGSYSQPLFERKLRETLADGTPALRGLVVHPPGSGPFSRATVDGAPVPLGTAGTVILRALPARIAFER